MNIGQKKLFAEEMNKKLRDFIAEFKENLGNFKDSHMVEKKLVDATFWVGSIVKNIDSDIVKATELAAAIAEKAAKEAEKAKAAVNAG